MLILQQDIHSDGSVLMNIYLVNLMERCALIFCFSRLFPFFFRLTSTGPSLFYPPSRLKPLIESLDDLSCDVPRAPEFLAEIVALVSCGGRCLVVCSVEGGANEEKGEYTAETII
jgi:hypothetical protein